MRLGASRNVPPTVCEVKYLGYDKHPTISIPESHDRCVAGWDAISRRLTNAIAVLGQPRTVVAVECYPGVHIEDIVEGLQACLKSAVIVRADEAMHSSQRIESLIAPYTGGDDPVFGYLTKLALADWYDAEKVANLQRRIAELRKPVVIVVGCGATHIVEPDMLVYANLSRWEAQLRFRRNEVDNLGVSNRNVPANLQYKQAFFVDWRVADRWKKPLMPKWDFVLDANDRSQYKLADGAVVRRGYELAVTRPFRVVPFFDPAPWGGQWMKEVCDLDRSVGNFGWCFDCVPEENSVLFDIGGVTFELPSIDIVFSQPRKLLGDPVHARFGDEFPIRFDFLDTMQGGNLSFQVHPLTEFIQQAFGMHYTQDESYYILDAAPDACVYLGLKSGADPVAMERDLRAAQAGGASFPADEYAAKWPARKHDHFLIPAGTCHCSGRNSMVLEISATPYIFTFKMWDWERLGLDGKPRPIHLDHALANIQWDCDERWAADELINKVKPVTEGDGWREERTGLHRREFIETRRHWFTKSVPHSTGASVHVLNLVEGEEAIVESPEAMFEPFLVHYAETFIVPANVGAYSIRPVAPRPDRTYATLQASVRY